MSATSARRLVLSTVDWAALRTAPEPPPPVAALLRPTVGIRFEVAVGDRGLRASYAVAGPAGASLFELADGAVELSAFDPVDLGRELVRAVPPLPGRINQALHGTRPVPSGTLPLSALTDVKLGGTVDALAAEVDERTTGVLRCLVTGRVPDGSADGSVAVGQVVWLAVGHAWVGLRPEPAPDGRRQVALVPVDRADIGGWLAPYLSELLEVSGGRG